MQMKLPVLFIVFVLSTTNCCAVYAYKLFIPKYKLNKQFTLKYTDKVLLQNKIFFLPTDLTLIGMGRWRGNKQYFKSGFI